MKAKFASTSRGIQECTQCVNRQGDLRSRRQLAGATKHEALERFSKGSLRTQALDRAVGWSRAWSSLISRTKWRWLPGGSHTLTHHDVHTLHAALHPASGRQAISKSPTERRARQKVQQQLQCQRGGAGMQMTLEEQQEPVGSQVQKHLFLCPKEAINYKRSSLIPWTRSLPWKTNVASQVTPHREVRQCFTIAYEIWVIFWRNMMKGWHGRCTTHLSFNSAMQAARASQGNWELSTDLKTSVLLAALLTVVHGLPSRFITNSIAI